MATAGNYKKLGRGRPDQFSTRISGIAITEEQGQAIKRWVKQGSSISEEIRKAIDLRIATEQAYSAQLQQVTCDED